VQDADDTAQRKLFATREEAVADMALLSGAGPLSWAELTAFGYLRD
jgi:hypothetical protein